MLLDLKDVTPEYKALKEYEDELVECLHTADVVALAKRAVECKLVTDKIKSDIKSLDFCVPQALKCKYLLFGIYHTIRSKTDRNESYKKWLSLLSSVISNSSVLSRMEKYHKSLVALLASRPSCEEGDTLTSVDIPLLSEVLAGCWSKWKQIAYSLLLSNADIEKVLSLKQKIKLNAFECLNTVLTMWALNKFSVAKFPNITNLKKVIHRFPSIVALKNAMHSDDDLDIVLALVDEVDEFENNLQKQCMRKKGEIDHRVSSVLGGSKLNVTDISLLFAACSDKWELIACSLRVSDKQIKESIKPEIMTPDLCLEEVLTLWVLNDSPVLKDLEMTLRSDVVNLGKEANKLRENIAKQGKYQKNCIEKRRLSILDDTKFNEDDISFVAEALAGCSEYWIEIAYSILLPDPLGPVTECGNLETVLTSWILNEFSSAKLPTLHNLEESLSSDFVGLSQKANELKKNLIFQGIIDRHSKSVDVSQSSNFEVVEGCSVLLSFEVSIIPEDQVDFEWFQENIKLKSDSNFNQSYYNGTSVSIFCLQVSDLTQGGSYICKAKHKELSIKSNPFVISVLTPVDKYRSILTDFYTEQPEVPEDTWPPVSANTYISLALIKQEDVKTFGNYARCTIRGNADDIMKEKESIVYKRIFSNLENGVRLLVEGRPGSGKSTLVHKISQDWANGELIFINNRLLLLVHLRAFSSDPNVGLIDIIKCFYDTDSTINDIRQYAEKHNGLGICFLLDGLDEYMPNKTNSFIYKLIRKQVLPKATVIVASRPAAAATFRSKAARQVEVIGFLREQIYDYVEKYPFSNETKSEGLHQYLDSHPNVYHMCYLPIHVAMVCFLYDNLESDLPQTETEIYKEFTKHTILRILYRTESGSQIFIESVDDLSISQKEHFKNVCKLAFEMTLSSKQVFKQGEVQSFFKLQDENDSLGLVTIDKVAARCGFQKMYTFHHLTFQEFLGASFLSNLDEMKQIELIERYSTEKQLQQVWKFYSGLVTFNEDCKKFRALISTAKLGTLFKVQCCFESQQSHVCDTAVENNTLSFVDTFLSPSNFTEIAFVICHTQQNPVEELCFEGCTFEKACVDILLNKTANKILQLKILCYSNCNLEQLRVVNYFLLSLPYLEVLDISNVNLGKKEIEILSQNLNHSSLQIVKVGSRGNTLYSSLDLRKMLVGAFRMKCSSFVNVCFSGISEVRDMQSYFHIDYPELDLSFSRHCLSEFKALSCDFRVNPFYTRVALVSCGIDDKAASVLSQGLKHCANLQELGLSFNNITNFGAKQICEVVSSCRRLYIIDMTFNDISDEGAMSLMNAYGSVQQLNLLLNVSKPGDISINALKLYKQNLNKVRANALTSAMLSKHSFKNILQICLNDSKICANGLRSLSNALLKCSSLLTLDLSSNRIDGIGAAILSDALGHCSDLQELDISSNFIGCDGVKAIAKCEGLKNLRVLKLSSNGIDESGPGFLHALLSHCTELDISSNSIHSIGAKDIAKCLKFNNFLVLNVSSNNIGEAGAEVLSEALKHCTRLQKLDISFNSLSSGGAKAIARGLIQCTGLLELYINSNDIGNDGTKAIANALIKRSKLEVLEINANGVGNEGSIALSATMRSTLLLRRLDISHNVIMSDGGSAIANSLSYCTHMCVLNISNNKFGDTGISALANSIKNMADLQELFIGFNNIGSDGIQALSSELVNCIHLSKLHLNNNKIGDNGAGYLAVSLQQLQNLQDLNISCNEIQNKGAIVIAAALKENKELQELDISNNHIQIDGVNAISETISHSSALVKVNVCQCLFGKDCASLIASSLKSCNGIQHLDISCNNVNAVSFSQAIKHCSSIKDLHLYCNEIDDSCAVILAGAISEHCKLLVVLDLSYNSIGSDGVNALAKVFMYCTCLQQLNISNNQIQSISGFCKGLMYAGNLRALNISGNDLEEKTQLASSLSHCKCLSDLNIRNVNLSVADIKALAAVFSSLHVLDVSCNALGDDGAMALGDALKHNTMLHTLQVFSNKITETGAEALAKKLQNCILLTTLNIGENIIGTECSKKLQQDLKHCKLLNTSRNNSHEGYLIGLYLQQHQYLNHSMLL